MRITIRILGVLLVAGFVAMQFVPVERSNPPVSQENTFEAVAHPPAAVTRIIQRSCQDCHTNQTVWPVYSYVWPVSYLVAQDTKEGRSKLNFSEWRGVSPEMTKLRMADMCEEAKSGGMPLWNYTLIHRSAKLSSEDISTICAWSVASR